MTARILLGFAAAACFLTACGDGSPTGTSPLLENQGSPPAASRLDVASSSAALGDELEEFNCLDVETERVRFGPPGYVEDDRVGLYVYFAGVPAGPKRIRIWWNLDDEPTSYRDFTIGEDETEIEEIYEHRYPGLVRQTEMLVRVELIRDGLTGNCARNRRVRVAPPGGSPSAPQPGPTTQTASVGPPIGSVNAYDSFYIEGVRFTVQTPLTLDGVWVDPSAGGTLVVNLFDGSGTTQLDSRSFVVSSGPQQLLLGFSIPPGDYVLSLDGTLVSGVGMTVQGASFPYEIPGVITLTDTVFNFGSFGWYYFLYDWQVTW